jgi:hypothetical protein
MRLGRVAVVISMIADVQKLHGNSLLIEASGIKTLECSTFYPTQYRTDILSDWKVHAASEV